MPELAPARVAVTSPDVALSGAITHDGVALAAGDSVLVAQPSSTLNGPYTVQTGAWTRRADWDTLAEMLPGSWLAVLEGATPGRAGSEWYFANPQVPAALGTTVLNWQMRSRGLAPRFSAEFEDDGTTVSLADVIPGGTFTNATLTLDPPGRVVGVSAGSVPPNVLEGLRVVRTSGTSFRVEAGVAWVPSPGRVLTVGTPIEKTGLVLTANTWYYVYLFEDAGAPDGVNVEAVTAAPDAPYFAGARTKAGDTTRRYIGPPMRTDANGALYSFAYDGYLCRWLEVPNVAPFRVLSAGASTTFAGVVCSAVVPPTSTRALLRALSNNGFFLTYNTIADKEITAHGSGELTLPAETNTLQVLRYRNAGTGTSVTLDVYGFYEVRA